MEKIFIYLLSVPLFIFFGYGGPHTGLAKNNRSAIDTLLPKKDSAINGTKTCISCHGNLTEKKNKHTTTTNKGCEDCHKTSGIPMEHAKGTIVLQNNMPELCLSCHDKTKAILSSSANVHSIIKDKKSCMNCHSPHSSDEKNLLIANKKELCLSCHSKPITTSTRTIADIGAFEKNSRSIHPPFKKCSASCHNPHGSSNYKMLNSAFTPNTYLAVNPDSFALCWVCHDPEMISSAQTTTATNFRNGDKNLHYVHVHGEKGRTCVMCHNPHASSNEHIIRDRVGFGKWEFKMNYSSDENGGSCAPGCHVERKYTR